VNLIKPTQYSVGGCIAWLTSKHIFVLGNDTNLYHVDLEEKKGLRNPLFREGLCVEVIYLSRDRFRVEDVVIIIPMGEEEDGEVDDLPVLSSDTASA